jgi:tetratricopeptide (TPR) repeat protein
MTDVFQVQADIAGQVVQALHVALGDSARRDLAAKPTQSLPAYDAFLRGEAALQGSLLNDPQHIRLAIAAYEQAVALDSTFLEAWARLGEVRARLYADATPTPAGAEAARRAAERALALAPDRPEGHQAFGQYYAGVRGDYLRAFTEDSIALAMAPGNAELLAALANSEGRLGRLEAARLHFVKAVQLDPRSVAPVQGLGEVFLFTRHYPQAEQAYDRALQLVPQNLFVRLFRAMAALAQGDLAGAQAIIKAAPQDLDPTTLVATVATFWDLYWVLDQPQQQLLLRLTPSAFGDDRATWGIVRAQTYWIQGNKPRARVYADSARQALEQQLQATPQDDQRHVFLGLMLAFLGKRAAAIREGERGVALLPISRAPREGAYTQHQLVRIYLLVGEPEKALDQLEPLLKIPYYLSPGWLKIDPNFAPLRGNPRFERLVAGKP